MTKTLLCLQALLQWREDEQRNGRPSMNEEEENDLIKVGGQQLLKAPLASADGGEKPSASQQVQGSNTNLQRLLQDEQLAKESQMKVQTDMFCVTMALFAELLLRVCYIATSLLHACALLNHHIERDTCLREPVKDMSACQFKK